MRPELTNYKAGADASGGVRVRFWVRFQAVKVPNFGGFPVENPTKKANRLKALLKGISLSEYGLERFRVRLRRLSEYGSVAYLVERPTRETRAEQYSDTVLDADLIPIPGQLELHGRCRCGVLLSTCFCALFVADLSNCGDGGIRITLQMQRQI